MMRNQAQILIFSIVLFTLAGCNANAPFNAPEMQPPNLKAQTSLLMRILAAIRECGLGFDNDNVITQCDHTEELRNCIWEREAEILKKELQLANFYFSRTGLGRSEKGARQLLERGMEYSHGRMLDLVWLGSPSWESKVAKRYAYRCDEEGNLHFLDSNLPMKNGDYPCHLRTQLEVFQSIQPKADRWVLCNFIEWNGRLGYPDNFIVFDGKFVGDHWELASIHLLNPELEVWEPTW